MIKVEVLYDDEYGTDLLIDDKHNVNLGWEHDTLNTHTSRDGKPMEVLYNETLGTYFVLVSR